MLNAILELSYSEREKIQLPVAGQQFYKNKFTEAEKLKIKHLTRQLFALKLVMYNFFYVMLVVVVYVYGIQIFN